MIIHRKSGEISANGLLSLKNKLIFCLTLYYIREKLYICIKIEFKNMEGRNLNSAEYNRLAFTVLAIEASAQKMGISPSEMRRRLDKVGLIKNLIQDCYDTLHTESRDAVATDVVEALKNRERE